MVEIREMLAPKGSNCRPGHTIREFLGVTIHETANTGTGAGAISHARFLQTGGQYNSISWHYAVDDKIITHSIPENEVAWHAGDGRSGNGNNKTIAIEICVNPESNFEIAKKNAIELAADILIRHNVFKVWPSLFMHKDWSGKNCPHNIIASNWWYNFNQRVEDILNDYNRPSELGPHYRIYRDLPGYYTAYDAVHGFNVKSTVKTGSYYVFKEVEGAINVSTKGDIPGTWINAISNARAKLEEIKVGDTVRLIGYVYADSEGNGKSHFNYDQLGKITKMAPLSRKAPFHFNTLGWAYADSIQEVPK